jgi:hypothetical protein
MVSGLAIAQFGCARFLREIRKKNRIALQMISITDDLSTILKHD